MQSNHLNLELQNVAIPSSIINVFAQSLYTHMESLVLDTSASLELFEAQEYTQLKTCLQAHIQQMQHLLNNVELLDRLEQKSA